ncbi:AbrB/MazE/SpoVT family DNA-binding domain-containing protein [uncultured Caulobacter sp.]|uniref:AbrB/MazE/SpoVT family DNA-binding domain-containing protein n=1 Tax=uncultured Caulobacter sp. TaxID=158749 RepID=UPI00262206C5|nr:AbrB/MazE/SpoVT family DNA-binding domain-containing protein [uncultured Caulobacter sp.]
MSRITVGTWGKSLAVRVPREIVEATGLVEGEQVEMQIHEGNIVLVRSEAKAGARERAKAAVERIRMLRKDMKLDGLSIRELIDEGRR